MSADYTRTIVFKVEDQAIKRATDRITRSLSNIERSLKKIETKGFTGLAKGAEQASKQVITTTDTIRQLQTGLNDFKKAARAGSPLDVIEKRFKSINKGITIQPFRGLVNEITKIPYVLKRGIQDWGTFFEVLTKGKKDIISTTAALWSLGVNVKNFGSKTITNLTQLGTALDKNATKAENFLNKMVLGIKMQNTSFALAQNTALARQKSLPGTLRRNIARSRVGREGSGFSDFSSGVGEYNPYKLATPTPRYGAGRIGPIHPTQHYALQSSPYMGKYDNATQKSIARHAKKHNLKIETLLGQISANTKWGGLKGVTGFTAAQYGPQPAPLTRMERWGFGNRANSKGWAASPGGRGGRVKGALQSGMIGGGFPLLFGQSPAAAVAGGIGGALGGALSPGFGFAGSIVATAVAQKIGEIVAFRKSIKELNADMQSMGFNAGFSAKEITRLGKSLGITKEEAVQVAEQFKRFGKSGGLFAKAFGGDFAKFSAVAQADDISTAMQAIKTLNKDMTLEEELRLTLALRRKGVESTINELIEDTLEKQKKATISGHQIDSGSTRVRPAVKRRQVAEIKEIDESNIKTIEELTKIRDLYSEIRIAAEENSYSVVKAVEDINTELRRLNSTQYQVVELSKQIGSSFSESFRGIIQGTMSVQDAFRNMFSRIADHFLDMAARMAAAQLQKGILSLFNFGANPIGGIDPYKDIGSNPMATSYFQKKAAGGPVSGGSPYIVGEKGPELFVPGSSGNIVPNHAMGGANIVVNVDASGSAVEGNDAGAREFGNVLAVAIQSELVRQKRPGGLLA